MEAGPGRLNPVVLPGVHIHRDENPRAIAFSEAVVRILKENGIAVDQAPPHQGWDAIPGLNAAA
ncbi:MAG: hypothetical protein WA400_11190, partial [Silvibacterium sp.]